jgi:precorrin-2 dehydrogenase/sirohydrochlorin ferrochelatase
VFAATNAREVNDAVVREAQAIGALVQRVDGDDRQECLSHSATSGDFSTPAVHRDGTVIVAVSTGGSPPLAAMIRDELAAQVDPVWSDMAEAMKMLRPLILQSADPEQRRKLFHRAATAEGVEVFRSSGVEGLKVWIFDT